MGIVELLAAAKAADQILGIIVSNYQKIRGSSHAVDDAAAIVEMDQIAADYDVRIARAKKNSAPAV